MMKYLPVAVFVVMLYVVYRAAPAIITDDMNQASAAWAEQRNEENLDSEASP